MVFIFHRFVPPTNVGGIAIDSYAVEYKEARFDWGSARRRVWPVGGCILSTFLYIFLSNSGASSLVTHGTIIYMLKTSPFILIADAKQKRRKIRPEKSGTLREVGAKIT